MGAKWVGKWQGGRVREARGRQVWVIERRGQVVTLDVSSEREALAEMALWERDPAGYRNREQSARDAAAVRLDGPTLADFLAHLARRGLTEEYRTYVRTYLQEWGEALARRDLRTVQLRELRQLLSRWKTARHHRIVALKSFTAWLREEDYLRRSEDPTIDLRVPPATPEKSVRAKGYPMPLVERFYSELESQASRDMICLRAKTGMHDTEIGRIASGDGVLRKVEDPSGIYGTVTFRHKNGRIHVVSMDAQTFGAAERLQARGSAVTRNALKVMLDRAGERIRKADGLKEAPRLMPGELRHSFATWASAHGVVVRPTEGGVSLDVVASVMGHLSPRTTKVFYEGNQIPPMIALPLRLAHPKDPFSGTARSSAAH